MKLCPFCGRAIEDDARYCSGCGKKINEHDEITHNPITEAMLHYDEMPDVITKRKRKIVRCPRCGEHSLVAAILVVKAVWAGCCLDL